MTPIVRQAVLFLIVVMPIILGVFMVALIGSHFWSDYQNYRKFRTKLRILRFIKITQYREQIQKQTIGEINSIIEGKVFSRIRGLRNGNGLYVMEQLSREIKDDRFEYLKKIALAPRYLKYLEKKLKSRDLSSALLIIKIIGNLNIKDFTPLIEKLLYRYHIEGDVQQICCMTLSRLGEIDALVNFYCDEKYPVVLSFRALQEIFDSFNGDREQLITTLIEEGSDDYIKRACIKSIGKNKLVNLAPLIMRFLYSDSLSDAYRIDAIRTMGQLRHRPAGPYIASLAESKRFEVRIAVVVTLGQIDLDLYFEIIFSLIFDPKWAVRYRAAEVLADYKQNDKIRAMIMAKNDKYALEVFNFMVDQKVIYKNEVIL